MFSFIFLLKNKIFTDKTENFDLKIKTVKMKITLHLIFDNSLFLQTHEINKITYFFKFNYLKFELFYLKNIRNMSEKEIDLTKDT